MKGADAALASGQARRSTGSGELRVSDEYVRRGLPPQMPVAEAKLTQLSHLPQPSSTYDVVPFLGFRFFSSKKCSQKHVDRMKSMFILIPDLSPLFIGFGFQKWWNILPPVTLFTDFFIAGEQTPTRESSVHTDE